MSVDIEAKSILGVKVDENFLYRTIKVRSCECNIDGNPKFCPECGKIFTRKIEKYVNGYDGDKFMRLEVVLCHDCKNDRNYYILTVPDGMVRIGEDKNFDSLDISPENIEKVRSKIKFVLEPLGKWDEKEFKLWLIIEAY
jgi:hypothetical protein